MSFSQEAQHSAPVIASAFEVSKDSGRLNEGETEFGDDEVVDITDHPAEEGVLGERWVVVLDFVQVPAQVLDDSVDLVELVLLFSQGLSLEFSDSLHLLDFFIGIFDGAGHGESLSQNSVEHELVVSGPLSSVLGESDKSLVGVFFEVGLEVIGSTSWSVGELSEEDVADIIIEVELNTWVVLLDSLEFNDKLLSKEGKSELSFDVMGWHQERRTVDQRP